MLPNEERRPGGGGVPDGAAANGNVGASVTDRAVIGARRCKAARAAAMERNQRRRSQVLRHHDLAAMLTVEPLGYDHPQQWNGFVPPALWREQPNASPRRAALVAICTEAATRERGQGVS